jgi:hypothetical protein
VLDNIELGWLRQGLAVLKEVVGDLHCASVLLRKVMGSHLDAGLFRALLHVSFLVADLNQFFLRLVLDNG